MDNCISPWIVTTVCTHLDLHAGNDPATQVSEIILAYIYNWPVDMN
jgi:hypothetical protein